MSDEELAPLDIPFDINLFSVNFHPTDDLVVVSDAEGTVKLFRYSLEENQQLLSLRLHHSGCREARFSTDGKYIFTASSDHSMKVVDVNTGQVLFTREEAHDKDFMLFTGDDEGTVKVWDMRQQNLVCEFQEHADFISEIITIDDRHIIATSGDGGVSKYNFVRRSLDDISEKSDNELLSVISMEDNQTLVCGSQDGTVYIYDINNLEHPKKFKGHPLSVDTLLKVNETSFLSGSSDGIIRFVGLKPKKLLGVIGEHQGFPVEKMAISRDNRYLGSISHDLSLKFWNVFHLYNDEDDEQRSSSASGDVGQMDEGQYEDDDQEDEDDDDEEVDMDSEDDSDSSSDDDMIDSDSEVIKQNKQKLMMMMAAKGKVKVGDSDEEEEQDESEDDDNSDDEDDSDDDNNTQKPKKVSKKQLHQQEQDKWKQGSQQPNKKKNKKKKSFYNGL
ncbi:WD40 repeat-containing protein [Cavenderia fasciculata]|uniref:WD40 repeat-containing protein n=1 Tax=Cavenderia fasciculata TaxID=261658 RepID=F4PVF0_CACFS|nr:WD40 repeat-containing protein [Cavenderia fasciculata]EGG19964.1 WD40 repeat-containing protein [Cavenderia fasciculata]|eukprot:XP_004366947.1 WD40 repeat-containing protein [Cavenderia fasciculata]